jgi:hypothetical protein
LACAAARPGRHRKSCDEQTRQDEEPREPRERGQGSDGLVVTDEPRQEGWWGLGMELQGLRLPPSQDDLLAFVIIGNPHRPRGKSPPKGSLVALCCSTLDSAWLKFQGKQVMVRASR